MNIEKIIIIFSGYNNRAIISFMRTLTKNHICFVIIANDKDDPIFDTVYRSNVVLTRTNKSLNLDLIRTIISAINSKYNCDSYFVIPSTEALNRFLQSEREGLNKLSIIVPIVDKNLYNSISDKSAFCDICIVNNISIPAEYNTIDDVIYPFVAKPFQYTAKDGSIHTPYLVFDSLQKTNFLNICNPNDFYYQEFVRGKSIYLLYYFHRNGTTYKYSQENIAQQPDGSSMVAAVSSDFHESDESDKYEKLFRELNFYGLVMVELKVNNEHCYMIEANPRLWGPSQLFVDAGANLFEAFLHDHGFITNLEVGKHCSNVKYLWFGGVMKTLNASGEISLHTNIDVNSLLLNLGDWLEYDVYRKPDTIDLFKKEISNLF